MNKVFTGVPRVGVPVTMAMARILVTEEIAEGGLDRLRAAGHEVDCGSTCRSSSPTSSGRTR
ncbi:MAG: hypothetical protein R2713_08525 [Ilumatobacteraceae bacterium]